MMNTDVVNSIPFVAVNLLLLFDFLTRESLRYACKVGIFSDVRNDFEL